MVEDGFTLRLPAFNKSVSHNCELDRWSSCGCVLTSQDRCSDLVCNDYLASTCMSCLRNLEIFVRLKVEKPLFSSWLLHVLTYDDRDCSDDHRIGLSYTPPFSTTTFFAKSAVEYPDTENNCTCDHNQNPFLVT